MPHMEEAMAAVEAGASVWVHVYNGCVALPTVSQVWLKAAFDNPETIGELIADGHHAVPAACKVLIKQKTPQGVALIHRLDVSGRLSGRRLYVEANFLLLLKMVPPASKKVVI